MLKRKNVFCGEAMERVIIVNRTDDAPVKLRQWIAAAINITLMKMMMMWMMRLRMTRMMRIMVCARNTYGTNTYRYSFRR